jgi:Ca2+-binding EF-hand superfamily protein
MGNKQASPIAQLTYAQACAHFGQSNMEKLDTTFKKMIVNPRVSKVSKELFISKATQDLGPCSHKAAQKLCALLDTDKSSDISFTEFAVGAFAFASVNQQQLLFCMFDSKQSGYLDRDDLADVLFVITASSDRPTNGIRFEDGSKELPMWMKSNTIIASPVDFQPKPFVEMMVEMVLYRFDQDMDGRLSIAEWTRFVEFEPNARAFASRVAQFMVKSINSKQMEGQ